MKTAEEILTGELSQSQMDLISKPDIEGIPVFKNWIIEAMESYAKLYHEEQLIKEKQRGYHDIEEFYK